MNKPFDYIRYRKYFKHFHLPPTGVDSKGFEDSLVEIVIDKIGELENRLREIKSYQAHSSNWFFEFFYTYQFEQERLYIERWLAYWKRLAGIKPVSTYNSPVTDDNIVRAREFPISELFQGQLRHAGANNFVGLCPFHQEKTPSFHIYPDHYYCYGCQAHGDSIDFLMKTQNKTFYEAVRELYAK